MMGLSLGKLIFTLVVVFGVWTVFRMIARRGSGRPRVTPADRAARMARDTTRARTGGTRDGNGDGRGDGSALDLIQCPSCGSYIPKGSTCHCGWKDTG